MAIKKLTKKEAVSVCYACMVLADGVVDQEEINFQAISPIAQRYDVDKNRAMIAEHIKNGTFEELLGQLPTPTLKKMSVSERNEIAGDLMLLSAIDGKVDEKEAKALLPIYICLGGSEEECNQFVMAFMKDVNEIRSRNSKSSGGCFVATATMGDYNHPVVIDLRNFRDSVLKKSKAGNIFIKIYYSVGPFFANLIEKNNFLKKFSYKFLIKPLHRLISKSN